MKSERFVKIVDPSDKAKRTMQSTRMFGRSTLKQQDLLAKLGFPRDKAVAMTKYAASQEIGRLLKRVNDEAAKQN